MDQLVSAAELPAGRLVIHSAGIFSGICAPISMHILERFRANSPFLRFAQAMLCALILLNVVAHLSHHHESQPSVSSERLICPYCSTFSAVISPREPVEIPPRAPTFCTLVNAPEERGFELPPVIAQWARGPPLIRPSVSTSFS